MRIVDSACNVALVIAVVALCWMQLDTWREVRKASAFIEMVNETVQKMVKKVDGE